MDKVVLVTGAARRLGAAIAVYLHALGYRVVIHCHHSTQAAMVLADQLNAQRTNSAWVYSADLRQIELLPMMIAAIITHWGQLDALIHNASVFYATDLASADVSAWDELMNTNAKAPFFLSQAAYPYLKKTHGQIIHITDIHAEKSLKHYEIYTLSKALLWHQTQCLAKAWAPEVRVNAVAPGAVLWPEGENSLDDGAKQVIINKTLLKKQVNPQSIAKAIGFLLDNSDITGEVIHVAAGRGV